MQFKAFFWLSRYGIISKYDKRTHQLTFKKELKNFPSRNNGGRRESLRTGVEWKGSHWTIRKRNTREHKESHKVWRENISRLKTRKLCFYNLSIRVSQSKTMQVETIYTLKNYLYIVTSGFSSQNKVEKICLISWGVFNRTNYCTRACWIWDDYR